VSDIVARIAAGELEDVNSSTIPPQTLRLYSESSDLRKYLHLNLGDLTDYLTMNLTQPPFDDVHVRRAMNWVMDKNAMVQAWGGPAMGKVANHIAPDTLFGNQLAECAPYRTPGDHARVAKAKGDEGLEVRHERRRHVQRLGVQERAAAHRHARRRPEAVAGRAGGRREDRHHVHGASGGGGSTRRTSPGRR
jgi:hypothetical protein